MKINQIQNQEIRTRLLSEATNYLINNNLINEKDKINYEVGYAYTENDILYAMYKISFKNSISYYFKINNDTLSTISSEEYEKELKDNNDLRTISREESEENRRRREKNNNLLKAKGIAVSDTLLCQYDENKVQLKSIDEVCMRAITALLIIQLSCDVRENDFEKSIHYYLPYMNEYNIYNSLNEKEKRLFNGVHTQQDLVDLDWEYEAYWALCWCLGLIDDISDASTICDCDKAIQLVLDPYHNRKSKMIFKTLSAYETYKDKCHMRSISEILDMEDLYLRYHWAINEKKVNPNANIGNLNEDVVVERRRALEWILSNQEDWDKIQLNA